MRFFNTAGPVRAEDHYVIPPLKRRKFAEILRLIRNKQYFVLHAPRQTGLLRSSFDSSTVTPAIAVHRQRAQRGASARNLAAAGVAGMGARVVPRYAANLVTGDASALRRRGS